MKKIIFTLIILFLNNLFAHCQISIGENNIEVFNKLPQEKIFVHYNSSLFLSGEQLLYKVYCINSETNNLSDLSKIAYIQLVGEDSKVIFNHKIRLESGMGNGDFLLPTSVASGNYKLIALTQWMRNGGETNFFQSNISIINPFHENQKPILNPNLFTNSSQTTSTPKKFTSINKSRVSDPIELKLNSKTFTNREKVSLKINRLKNELSYGNYSISVRKLEGINKPHQFSSKTYTSLFAGNPTTKSVLNSNSVYVPEHNGELITGKVSFKDTFLPASNIKIALSIPGKSFIFKISITNKFGIFYFDLDEEYEGRNAIIQVMGNEKENYTIELHEQASFNYENLVFNKFRITPKDENWILQRSIYNQIENAYYSVKLDRLKTIKPPIPFYPGDYIYNLDDFTRFPTIKETIVEVIDNVWITQKKDKPTFHVRIFNSEKESDLLPMILMDGILIQNHKELFDYDANKVRKISVITDKFSYYDQLFGGVISVETLDGNYECAINGNYIKNVELFKPLLGKHYFQQVYNSADKLDRIPDYRSQLYWNPDLTLNKKESIITFFTSDNTGDYEIRVEGFTNGGKSVSLTEVIRVKSKSNN